MNALLNYGSSTSSSESDDEDKEKPTADSLKPKLPKPSLGESSLQTSVFSNPFVEAELAKAAILEKHVKMVPGKSEMMMINGKKICWNYRKGRCRFGHNCKYAHDSDIQKSQEELEAEKEKHKTVVFEGSGTMTSAPPPMVHIPDPDEGEWEDDTQNKRRKRPGLSDGIVPSKKVIKMYKNQKNKECNKNKFKYSIVLLFLSTLI